jgi:oxepin-CoA hydrolase/3-oxo-5,6-dehydrosuberyl-CoA semialdehyde dehydrogenase
VAASARARSGARQHGLDTLRFVKPVGIGDTIQARLTCKRKIDRNRKDANLS